MLIDAHAHLDMYDDTGPALDEIRSHRILTVSNSMDLASYERNLEIARECDLIVPTFGVHPWRAPRWAGRLGELEHALSETPMLGEIGLDHRFIEDASLYPAQQEVFEFLLSAASEQGKIVNLHTSGAEADVLRLLDRHGVDRVIVHWYFGPLETFRALVERRALFTFGVAVLHSDRVREFAKETPGELLLMETDNPGGPEWLTGSPGRPGLLLEVVEALAKIREATSEEIEEAVARNFRSLIDGDPWMADVSDRFF